MSDLQSSLLKVGQEVSQYLSDAFTQKPNQYEILRPKRLIEAIRYSLLNGGKRIRPFLVIESAKLFDVAPEKALGLASAVECIHAYSLIHDDLPAMDDDDMRRGQPSLHKAYDEATAILAGDGLLTMSFSLIADSGFDSDIGMKLVSHLSQSAGIGGMVGGQIMDIEGQTTPLDERAIITMQAMKTGALLKFCCQAGAIAGRATHHDYEILSAYGSAIGLAFQLADDLLDISADTKTLGKTAGKDVKSNKATLVALNGVEWAQQQLTGLIDEAEALLAPFKSGGDNLREIARFIKERRY